MRISQRNAARVPDPVEADLPKGEPRIIPADPPRIGRAPYIGLDWSPEEPQGVTATHRRDLEVSSLAEGVVTDRHILRAGGLVNSYGDIRPDQSIAAITMALRADPLFEAIRRVSPIRFPEDLFGVEELRIEPAQQPDPISSREAFTVAVLHLATRAARAEGWTLNGQRPDRYQPTEGDVRHVAGLMHSRAPQAQPLNCVFIGHGPRRAVLLVACTEDTGLMMILRSGCSTPSRTSTTELSGPGQHEALETIVARRVLHYLDGSRRY